MSSLLLCGCTDNSAPTKIVWDDEPASNSSAVANDTADSLGADEKKETSDNTPAMVFEPSEQLSENNTQDTAHAGENNTAEEASSVTIDFIGDINFDDGYSNMSHLRSAGGHMSGVLSPNIIDELKGADIFMANNEFPYSNSGSPTPNKTFTFRAKPERVGLLKEMGVDIVSLANNHAYDYGSQALLDTLDILSNEDIAYVGAGKNITEACQPAYITQNGLKIGFVSATQIERTNTPDTKEATENTPGVLRTLDPTRFLKVISEADANCDFTVVYVHWGSENTYDVDASQKDLAKKYVDAGADLIIGDHSHCLQGFEYINDVPVIYSLGNFWFSSKNIDTGIVKATVNKQGLETLQFLPCLQHDCRTDMFQKGESEYTRILGVMVHHSKDVSIDEDGYVTKGAGHGVSPVEPKPVVKPNYSNAPAAPEFPEAVIPENPPEVSAENTVIQ